MPYDPALPANGAPIVAAELRDQFAGIVTLLGDYATAVDVNNAIVSGSANNCDGVSTLNLTVSNPPTQATVQAIANKLDELITALKRV